MCIVLICKDRKPDLEVLEQCENYNPDGGGIAWTENDKVKWIKGLNCDEILKITDNIKLPFIIHFRIATAGGAIPELCHPFTVSDTVKTDLNGDSDAVIMHNGHWNDWKASIQGNIIHAGITMPTGAWSDTRAIAYFTKKCGTGFLEYIDEKVVLFKKDSIEIFGSGWVEDNGITFSNETYKPYNNVCKWNNKTGRYDDKFYDSPFKTTQREFKQRNATITTTRYIN